ncbi:MAG: hypothetical protein B7Z74_02050 [Deltaproteobacteria bacterium 21-66-5]|nr:MAG: hypothetical protein B7Z74_02050 [Deltaproteobacteria bacterium 21-66-5]
MARAQLIQDFAAGAVIVGAKQRAIVLGKLRGVLDNETMASLLREASTSDPKAVARRFLKSRKLI